MALLPSDWIEKSIRINTETHVSNSELVRFLRPLLEQSGLQIEEQRVQEKGTEFVNVLAFSHSPTSPGLMAFNTHLDTVAAGSASLWTKTHQDPFRATVSRSRVYGLGSADVKLDFLCKIMAARNTRPWRRPICLVGTYGEERGLVGADRLLKSGLVRPKYAIVGEPSNLELIYAHKGHLVMTVSIPRDARDGGAAETRRWKGRAAHSSTPELGQNALAKGLTDCFKRSVGIQALRSGTNPNRIPDECEVDVTPKANSVSQKLFKLVDFLSETSRDLLKRRDPRFKPATCTLSLTMAVTTEKAIEITFDVRVLPEVNIERLQERLLRGIEMIGLSTSYQELNFPLKGKKESPLLKLASRALKDCRIQPICKTKASSTEASLYQKAGAQSFVFGPGISVGNVHRPNEFNFIRQLDAAVHFYSKLMSLSEGLL